MKKILALLIPLLVFSCNPAIAALKAVVPLPNTVTSSGSFTSGNCVQFSTSGTSGATVSDAGAACGSGGGGTPGGSPNQVQYNAAGSFGGFTFSGDCTLVVGTGVITCTKTGGVAFGTLATQSGTFSGTSSGTNTGDQTTAGTANRISITNGATNPIVDISAAYVGQSSITTLGTIGTGTWQGSVIGSSFGGAGSVSGALKANGSGTVSQAACGDLSNGATGCSTTVGTSATVNTGTSGATIPLNNGNNTFSGNDIHSGTLSITGTSTPPQAGGTLGLAGTATAPTLGANSEGDIFLTSAGGLNIIGQGSTNDYTLLNKGNSSVCTVATGTTNLNCVGLQVGGTSVLTGNQSITLSSDVTGSGTTAITTTIANNAVTNAKAAQGGANTMKGNWTSGTANEADNAMPSCSDSAGNHLNYVSGTGITCGTSDLHVGTVTSVGGDGTVISGTITTAGSFTLANAGAGTVLGNATSSSAAPIYTSAPVLGKNATTGGTLGLANGGATGTTITLQNLGNTTAYNFNFPTTAGGAGQVLTSQGGGTNNMTWAADNVGGGMFNYSDNGVTVTANTYFTPIGGGGIPQTTEAAVDVPSPSATTVTNLQVGVSVAPGAGNSYTITLRDAGSDTTLTCQISGAVATTCSDLTHSVNVAQNDLIDWKFVSAGTIITTPTVTISANNGTSNVGVTSVATNNGLTGGTITTTGTVGLASVANNSVLCNNTGGSAVPTAANCTVTGTGNAVLSTAPTIIGTPSAYFSAGAAETAVFSNGNSGTSKALNIDNGNLQSVTISGAVAMTLTAPTHPGKTTVVITQDGTGHIYSISGCKWPGGTAITYSTAASKVDIISIMYDGSNFYCMGGAAFS